jgi:ADP-heptose:LPS heptosyltransferase
VDFDRLGKILIVRDDRIGDVVLTLPMASAIKAARADVRVHVLLRERTAPLATGHPHVDGVITMADGDPTGATVLDALRRERFDLAIVPHSTGAMAALVHRAGVPLRMGNGFRWHSWRYNLPVFQKRRVPAKHELDYNLDLLRPWMRVPERKAVRFHAPLDEDAGAAVREFLASRDITRYIIVHPGSGGRPSRRELRRVAPRACSRGARDRDG